MNIRNTSPLVYRRLSKSRMQIELMKVPMVKKKMFSFKSDGLNGSGLAIKLNWAFKVVRVWSKKNTSCR
jgi:hypothetical protein